MFKQFIYYSQIKPEYDLKDVYTILKTARTRNPELGLSGYLVYGNGFFLQILEGVKAPLDSLVAKITKDERHFNMQILSEDSVKFLSFENWAMGFANLVDDLGSDLEAYMKEIGQLEEFNPSKMSAEEAKKFLFLFSNR